MDLREKIDTHFTDQGVDVVWHPEAERSLDRLMRPWRRFMHEWWPPSYLYRRFMRWPLQRVKRGYSDRDAWNLNNHIGLILCGALESYQRGGANANSYPNGLEPEEWHAVVDQMREGFCIAANMDSLSSREDVAVVEQSLSLLQRHFGSLWD